MYIYMYIYVVFSRIVVSVIALTEMLLLPN
jgi:hypothetical protein